MSGTQEYVYQDLALVEDFATPGLGVVQGWQQPQAEPRRLVPHGPESALTFVENFISAAQVIGWELPQEAAHPPPAPQIDSDVALVEDFATPGLGVVQGWQHEQARLAESALPTVDSQFALVEFTEPTVTVLHDWLQPQAEPARPPHFIDIDLTAFTEDFATPGLGVVQGWLREHEIPPDAHPPTPDSALFHVEPQRGPSYAWWRPQDEPTWEPPKPQADDLMEWAFVELDITTATTTKGVISLTGRYAPTITLEGRWAPTVALTGRWAPTIEVDA